MGAQLAVHLETGLQLDRDEFLRRWHDLPDLKRAELIDGVVYVPSPVSGDHAVYHLRVTTWIGNYQAATPGCEAGDNPTVLMLTSAPQPDAALWYTRSGRLDTGGTYPAGVPELIFEVCVTTSRHDLGPKLALYQRAGVQEYITAETEKQRLIWRELVDGSYRDIQPDPDGIIRSRVFPGLWLDVAAFWARDSRRMSAVLNKGIRARRQR